MDPFIPSIPFTNPKFKTGLFVVPVIVAVADPDNNVDTFPIVIFGVFPSLPFTNPKFKTGLSVVPVIVAVDTFPDNKDVTVPIVNVGVNPVCPITPTVLKINNTKPSRNAKPDPTS